MDDNRSNKRRDVRDNTPGALLARVARAFGARRSGDAYAAPHEELGRLGFRSLKIAAVDERSLNRLRYEFQADEGRQKPQPLDPHPLAFALAADRPRVLTAPTGDAKSFALACPIKVAGAKPGSMLAQSGAESPPPKPPRTRIVT